MFNMRNRGLIKTHSPSDKHERLQIFKAACAYLLETKGLDWGPRDIGRLCGCSAGLLYNYFPDREGLIEETLGEQVFLQFEAKLKEMASKVDWSMYADE